MAFVPVAAAIATVAATGVSAYGSYQAGQASKASLNYQAAVAKNNQIIENQRAEYAANAAEAQAAATSLKGAAAAGKLKAIQGASGVDVNSGSAVDVQEAQAEQSQLDTETVLSNALLESYGYRARATGYGAQAGLDTFAGSEAAKEGNLKAAGTLLGAASSIGGKWTGGTGDGFTPKYTGELPPNQPEDI